MTLTRPTSTSESATSESPRDAAQIAPGGLEPDRGAPAGATPQASQMAFLQAEEGRISNELDAYD